MKKDLPSSVILDTRHSPYARLRSVPVKDVQLEDGFWRSRYEINQEVTIPSQYDLLESTGRFDNFRRVPGSSSKPFQGYVFNDSDVYKWLEAASWTLAYQQNEDLQRLVDQVINLIVNAQDKDGYLNTYFSLENKLQRWTNLRDKHELYCAGHLIQAAIAHYRATGCDNLLVAATRLADHIYGKFGSNKREGTPGHPEIEMALIELYRTTVNPKYLELVKLFIDRRGFGLLGGREYLLDHVPFRQLQRLSGHAVRALYLCSGATDLYLEAGENLLLVTLERLWGNLIKNQVYITGGVGSRHDGESIGDPYELPNARAYAETCAAIANMMWNWRMLQIDGNAQYADFMEWTLYNAILPGISLDGKRYFYVNPLSNDGSHRRQVWFECACCPPNISRTLAMLPGYIYSTSGYCIWIHLYVSSHAYIKTDNGVWMGIKQTTNYPWSGQVKIELTNGSISEYENKESTKDCLFSLFLRIPQWVMNGKFNITVNNEAYENYSRPGSYLEIRRLWQVGDIIELEFPLETKYIESNPLVYENTGRIAITRGPLVYCLESVDNQDMSLSSIVLDTTLQPNVVLMPELLEGLVQLRFQANIDDFEGDWVNRLYQPLIENKSKPRYSQIEVNAIPYFVWANRAPSEMQVWLRYI